MWIKRMNECLKEGMRINLAGRIGRISHCKGPSYAYRITVVWDDFETDVSEIIFLDKYPGLLIEKPEAKISRMALNQILEWVAQNRQFHNNDRDGYSVGQVALQDYLDSMTEKEVASYMGATCLPPV